LIEEAGDGMHPAREYRHEAGHTRLGRTVLALLQRSAPVHCALVLPERLQSNYHESKASQIGAIARRILDEHNGELPCDDSELRSFKGVDPKRANLVLAIACGGPRIAVDVGVHRVTNRWGRVHDRTPEQTLAALEAKLPWRYWVEITGLLIPFGKHTCTAQHPRCSTCRSASSVPRLASRHCAEALAASATTGSRSLAAVAVCHPKQRREVRGSLVARYGRRAASFRID
jgi:adenine-specific DNA glycosylase